MNLIYKKYHLDSWPRGFVLCGRHPWMEIYSHKHLRETLSICPRFNSLLGSEILEMLLLNFCITTRPPLKDTYKDDD